MPLIIAHRGASADAPENTLAAFALAQAQGAEMLELDVQCCAEGIPIVFHDATTERWNNQPRPVQTCSLDDIRALDIGGEQVPTFEEVCVFARERDIRLNVELKQTESAAPVAALLRAHGLEASTVVSSFAPAALHALRRHAPEIARGYLMGTRTLRPHVRAQELWPFFQLRAVGARAWHAHYQLRLLKCVLPLVRRAGYAVYVWTVDDPTTMRRLAALGASGIITNLPAVARAALRS